MLIIIINSYSTIWEAENLLEKVLKKINQLWKKLMLNQKF